MFFVPRKGPVVVGSPCSFDTDDLQVRLNRICGAQGLRQQQALQDSGGIRLQKRLAEYGISRLPSQGVRQKCEPNFHCTVR